VTKKAANLKIQEQWTAVVVESVLSDFGNWQIYDDLPVLQGVAVFRHQPTGTFVAVDFENSHAAIGTLDLTDTHCITSVIDVMGAVIKRKYDDFVADMFAKGNIVDLKSAKKSKTLN
jgi:hypothetical protein